MFFLKGKKQLYVKFKEKQTKLFVICMSTAGIFNYRCLKVGYIKNEVHPSKNELLFIHKTQFHSYSNIHAYFSKEIFISEGNFSNVNFYFLLVLESFLKLFSFTT